MLEKPDIRDEVLIDALRAEYLIPVTGVAFLPVGNDPSAWSYRVDTEDRNTFFLKIRTELENPAGFLVPRFLSDCGVEQVLAPLLTKNQELWCGVEDFFFILYPFLKGIEAMESGMSDAQWNELGRTLKRIHATQLPPSLSRSVQREPFIPKWGTYVREVHKRVVEEEFDDPYQKELALCWKDRYEVIQTLIERTETIGSHLRQTDPKLVLCHADIHTANILLTPDQKMFIVDWDGTLLAPKERDLMFVLEGDTICRREEQIFLDGYGDTAWNPLILAYYRYEWCIQEIGDYGKRVFSKNDVGERTRRDALAGFMQLFSPADVVEAALKTYGNLK